jgi:hypothetical protein
MPNTHVIYYAPYVEFHLCTMATLEKLLGTRSFNSMVGHLAYCQVILFVFSRGFALPLVVQLVAPIFLGCLALIFLHLSIISNWMINLLFSMQWHMLRLTFFFFRWHYGILELYCPRLLIIKSPFEILMVQSYPHLHALIDHLHKEFATLIINVPLHGTQTYF